MIRLAGLFALVLAGWALAGPDEAAVKVGRLELRDDGAGKTSVVQAWGSGTVVRSAGGRALVLTCRHVVRGDGAALVVRAGGRSYPAELLGVDDGYDLAALRVRAELPAAELADRPPREGDPLRQWGHTLNGPKNERAGRAAGVQQGAIDGRWYDRIGVASYPSDFGDSGAGVFDRRGRLVGVCEAKGEDEGGQTRALFVTLPDVRRFLAKWGDP